MLRFRVSAEVWRAWFSAQLNIEIGLTSISLETLVGRDSRPNCVSRKELRRHEPRSRFPKKPPFQAHFRAFYPHPAHKSSLRAEWATHFLAPRKRRWSPPSPGYCSPVSRSTPDQRGEVVRRTSPAGYCLTPTAELPRILRGPIIRRLVLLFILCHRMDDSCGQINPSSPLAAARPTLDHSLVAGGAQRQGLQTCRPYAHQPECLFSRCRLRKYSAW